MKLSKVVMRIYATVGGGTLKRLRHSAKKIHELARHPKVRRAGLHISISAVVLLLIGAVLISLFPNAFDFRKKPSENITPAQAGNQFVASSGNLVTGTEQNITSATAVNAEGVNHGSWKGTLHDDNLHWVVAGTSSGVNVQLNLDGTQLYGGNKLIVQTEFDLDATVHQTAVQICDWVSTTSVDNAADAQCTGGGWRTINTKDASGNPILITGTTAAAFQWHIYDGYFLTGTTGGSAVSTPLSNFITTDANKRIKIRYFSTTNSTSTIAVDYLRVMTAIDTIHHPASFTNLGSGTPAGHYGSTNDVANTASAQAATTTGDGIYLTVPGTAGSVADFYVSFKNIKSFNGMNTLAVRSEYSCDNTGVDHRPKIWNFSTSAWEDLTTASIACSASDAASSWAKNNITMANYVSSGEARIGWRGLSNSTVGLRLDYIYLITGATNTDNTQCEISFGTGTATSCLNTRTLDTTVAASSWSVATEAESTNMGTGEANSHYPFDHDADGTNGENSAAMNMYIPTSVPGRGSIVGVHFSHRASSGINGSNSMSIRDFSGLTTTQGGWVDIGETFTPGGLGTLIYTDSLTGMNINTYGVLSNPEDYVDTATGRVNFRLRKSDASTFASDNIWDFGMASIMWIEDTHPTQSYQFTSSSQNLVTGTDQAIVSRGAASAEGVNAGSWKGTLADDNYHWVVAGTSSGINIQLNTDNVRLNGANKMLIETEFDLDSTVHQTMVQICDWVSTTSVDTAADAQCTGGGWRTINTRNAAQAAVAVTATTAQNLAWHIYDGYWSTGTNGGTPVSTPLTNFVDTTSNRVKIRYFSTTNSTATISIDYLRFSPVIDSVYEAASFTNLGSGTPTNNFNNTHVIGNAAAGQLSTSTTDNINLTVPGTAGSVFDFYVAFKNVKTYTGMNTLMFRADYSCSTTGINHRPKIWNFNSSAWEDLSTANIACSATEAINSWAKNNVTITDYVSNGEVRFGWRGLSNSTVAFNLDLVYMMVGSTNTDTALCERTLGTGTASNCTNARNLDTNATASTWDNPTEAETTNRGTGEANSFYAHDNDEFIQLAGEDASAQNMSMTVTLPNSAAVTGIHYASRMSGGAAGTVATTVRDYAGLDTTGQSLGGWIDVGFTTTSTMFHTDSIQAMSAAGVNGYGLRKNPEDYVDTVNNRMNLRFRTWTGSATAATRQWDFGMVSISWIEPTIKYSGKIYSDEGSSLFNCSSTNLTVALVINGADSYSGICTTSGGDYEVSVVPPAAGDAILVYLDGETQKAATLSRIGNSTTAFSTIDMYLNRVIARSDGGILRPSTSHFGLYDSADDSDIQYTFTGANMTVASGNKFIVDGSNNNLFSSDGDLTTPAVKIDGRLSLNTFTLTLTVGGTSATCTDAPGTVKPVCLTGAGQLRVDTGTVNYTGTTSTTVAGVNYYNLGVGTTSDSTATTYTLEGDFIVESILTVGNGSSSASDTLAGGTATLNLAGPSTPFNITSQGSFSAGTSTVLYTGDGSNVSQATYNQLKIGSTTRLARQAGMTLTEEINLFAAVIDQPNGFAYFGTNTSPGKIVKVRLSDFSRVDSLTLNSGENSVRSAVYDGGNNIAYFGLNTSPGTVVKINLANFTRVGAVAFNTGENNANSAVIDLTNNFAYFSTTGTPGLIVKINLTNFTRDSALTLNSGEDTPLSAVIDVPNGFAYFGLNTDPGTVVKINLSNFTRVGAISFVSQEGAPISAVIDQPNGFAYFGTFGTPGRVVKVNLASFTRVGAITFNNGENHPRSAIIDQPNGFVYFGTQTSPGNIIKIDLSNFTQTGTLTLNTGESHLFSAVIDQPNSLAYFGGDSSAGIIKINLSNFTRVSRLELPGDVASLNALVIDEPNGYAYFGVFHSGTDGAGIVRIRLSDFTFAGDLNVSNLSEDFISAGVIDQPNGFAYFASARTPASVIKVDLSTFTKVGTLALNTGENDVRSAVIDQPNGFAYFGTSTSPGIVVKVNLATFTRVGAITLNSGENVLRKGVVIDQPNGFIYWGTQTSPANIVKIRLSDFTRIGALTLGEGQINILSGFIDQPNGFAYFGTNTSPAFIFKIRLSDFTNQGFLTLHTGENGAQSAAIDQPNGVAYIGTNTSPARVVKINLATFTRMESITLNSGENVALVGAYNTTNKQLYIGTNTNPGNIVQVATDKLTSHTLGTAGSQTITSNSHTNIIGNATAATNNPTLDVNGNFTIESTGTYTASNSAPFTVAGNWTKNGTFNSGTGTVTFDTTGTSTLTGATSFHNFTSTTAGKTLQFQKHTAGVPVFTFTGTYLITGASGNQIHIHSDTPGSQWKAHFTTAQSSVTYAHIHDAGCNTGTSNVTLDGTSTNDGNNDTCWVFPTDPTFEQSAYRFANNEDATTVNYTGSPSQDSPLTVTTSGQKFRLRLLIHVGTANVGISGQNFKLRFGEKPVGGCAVATYSDVATGSGVIRFFDNPTPADGDNLTANGGDPTHSGHTIQNQDYEESNNFTNSVSAINTGQDGKWDFSLENNSSVGGKRYCFKVTEPDNTDIDTYTVYPEVNVEEELSFSLDGTSKNFGVITPGGSPSDQTSTVTTKTNAASGYQVSLWATQLLTKGAATIPNWTGTNATPTTFSGVGFGYSTNDSNLGGGTADRFTNPSAKFAGFSLTGSGDRVADNTGPAFNNENFNITYRLAVSGTQQAGTYDTTLIYICTGSY